MLTAQEREEVAVLFQRAGLCPGDHLKSATVAVIGAIDDWVEANQASYNAALPALFRNNASSQLKALALFFVVRKRVGL